MAWHRVEPATSTWSDVPVASVLLGFVGAVKAGDVVVLGMASTPDGGGFVVADDQPPGTFAWTTLADQVFSAGSARVGLAYAIAVHPATAPAMTVGLTVPGLASYLVMGCIYRHGGSLFTDQSTIGFGNGSTLTGGLITPSQPGELAIAFGATLPQTAVSSADLPLILQPAPIFSGVWGGGWADALLLNVPFTPTINASIAGDWAITAMTFGANLPPGGNPPGSFLGSGLEPFPMRRMPERGDHSSITQIRRIELLGLFK